MSNTPWTWEKDQDKFVKFVEEIHAAVKARCERNGFTPDTTTSNWLDEAKAKCTAIEAITAYGSTLIKSDDNYTDFLLLVKTMIRNFDPTVSYDSDMQLEAFDTACKEVDK